jgi:hypothetical protein
VKRLLALILVTASLSACSYGELLEFAEGSESSGDLTSEGNPTDVQAAGSITEAKSDDEQAKERVAEALDPEVGIGTKIGLANEAVRLRPADPRYMVYRAVFNLLAGDEDAAYADLAAARGLSQEAYPPGEHERRYAESFLDATYGVMRSYPEGSETRERMEFVYCMEISRYRANYGSTLLGSAYLDFTAHPELCD